LFQAIRAEFGTVRGLYPGCFVHVTPSFVIPEMHYVDSDRNANRFFADGMAQALVEQNRVYDESPFLRFHFQDYRKGLPIADGTINLVISQYAGFVSETCKRYLARGGYLIANNSRGDRRSPPRDAPVRSGNVDISLTALYDTQHEAYSGADSGSALRGYSANRRATGLERVRGIPTSGGGVRR
jgi:hypothetical protein